MHDTSDFITWNCKQQTASPSSTAPINSWAATDVRIIISADQINVTTTLWLDARSLSSKSHWHSSSICAAGWQFFRKFTCFFLFDLNFNVTRRVTLKDDHDVSQQPLYTAVDLQKFRSPVIDSYLMIWHIRLDYIIKSFYLCDFAWLWYYEVDSGHFTIITCPNVNDVIGLFKCPNVNVSLNVKQIMNINAVNLRSLHKIVTSVQR